MANRKLFVPALSFRAGKGNVSNVSNNSNSNLPVKYDPNHRRPLPVRTGSGGKRGGGGGGMGKALVTAAGDMIYDNRQNIIDAGKKWITGVFSYKGSNSVNDGNGSYALSKAPNPKEISLNSNVKPNTYANDYMYAVENLCSPLQLTACKLQLPTSGNNNLNSYVLNTIMFDLQTRAQSAVGFDLNIAAQFTALQLQTAFNAGIDALHVYYFYTSILSYESDPRNKNEGMINLRAQITPQIMSDLTQLGRRLEDTPMPPRIVEWVRYMNGNFLSGDTQGAPIIKILYDTTVLYGVPATSLVSTALTNLTSTANNTVFSLIRKCVPKWRIGTLYDVPSIPTFDKNFLTIFANLPFSFYNGTVNITTRTVATADVSVSYNSFHNNLDGVAFAMAGVNVTGVDMLPGLVKPPSGIGASVTDSRISWYKVGSTTGWYFVGAYPFLVASRLETSRYLTVASSEITPHLFGCDKCQNVSGNTLLQTARNTIDFLFDIDSIPYKGKLSDFNGTRNSKI